MSNHRDRNHLSAEALQAFLDESLPGGERERVETHLETCARCRSELEGWELLFHGLEGLDEVAPAADFTERVMTSLPRDPAPAPGLLGRLLEAVGLREAESPGPGHLTAGRAQDFLEGLLPRPAAEAVERHLHGCRLCREEVDGWRSVMVRLDDVPRLTPSAEFSERVMAHVRIRSAVVAARPTLSERFQEVAARLTPRSRKGIAGLAGAAVTPTAVLALVAYTVFSHPMVTVGTLLSFLSLKGQEALASLMGSLGWDALGSTAVARIVSVGELALQAPAAALALAILLCGMTLASTWVLYRNLMTTPALDGSYAH